MFALRNSHLDHTDVMLFSKLLFVGMITFIVYSSLSNIR